MPYQITNQVQIKISYFNPKAIIYLLNIKCIFRTSTGTFGVILNTIVEQSKRKF